MKASRHKRKHLEKLPRSMMVSQLQQMKKIWKLTMQPMLGGEVMVMIERGGAW